MFIKNRFLIFLFAIILPFSYTVSIGIMENYAKNSENISYYDEDDDYDDYDDYDDEDDYDDDYDDSDSDSESNDNNIMNMLNDIYDITTKCDTEIQNARTNIGKAFVENVIFPERYATYFNTVYQGIKPIILAIALSMIVLITLFYGFKVYVLWTSGNPEENPFELLVRFFIVGALMLCYEEIYNIAGNIIISIMQSIEGVLTNVHAGNSAPYFPFPLIKVISIFLGIITFLIYYYQYFKALFNTLKMGLELLILRLGFPLVCLDKINTQSNSFNAYILVYIKQFITILIHVVLMNLATLLYGGNILKGSTTQFWAIACLMLLNGTKEMLNQFIIPSSSGGMGGTVLNYGTQAMGAGIRGGVAAVRAGFAAIPK